MRLLRPADLPKSLWDSGEEVLALPAELAAAYEQMIDRRDLRALVVSRQRDDSPVGGLTQAATDEHFAKSFDGSAARVELALLDPKNHLPGVSNALVSALSGNSLVLTDAPCGAGAAGVSLLTVIAELRERGVLPREPLSVTVIGAELSEPARVYASELLEEIRPILERQAVFLDFNLMSWDVCSSPSTVDLISAMVRSFEGSSGRLLVVANFSGFLAKHGKQKAAQPQIERLLQFSSGPRSVAVWIEPQMNRAFNVFEWLRRFVPPALRPFLRTVSPKDGPELVGESAATFRCPLRSGLNAKVRVAVMAIDLKRTS